MNLSVSLRQLTEASANATRKVSEKFQSHTTK